MSGPLNTLKSLLAAHHLKPRKSLGQNFLIDPNFARAVAGAAAPDSKTLVLEVGPGTGVLTKALLNTHPQARVLAMELDSGLAELLRSELAPELAAGRFTLLEGDALAGKHELNPELVSQILEISKTEQRPRRVLCANLPYNAATPLIANLALPFGMPEEKPEVLVKKVVATIQLELAQRFFGAPSSADYGPLTAFLALRGRGSIVRRVGPEIFWPRPQVSSAVVEIELPAWEQSQLRPEEARAFQAFLQRLFQQRRKVIRAVVKGKLPPDDSRAASRAEDLNPQELLELFRQIENSQL